MAGHNLARSLAVAGSRRRFLKGLVGGTAAMGAGLVGIRRGEAACPSGVVAGRSGCVCKATGQTLCNGVAVDLSNDVSNRGSCGYACPASTAPCAGPAVCRASTCLYPPLVAGTVCRPAVGARDASEVYDGVSLSCPADLKARDGTPCDDGNLCTENEQWSASGSTSNAV